MPASPALIDKDLTVAGKLRAHPARSRCSTCPSAAASPPSSRRRRPAAGGQLRRAPHGRSRAIRHDACGACRQDDGRSHRDGCFPKSPRASASSSAPAAGEGACGRSRPPSARRSWASPAASRHCLSRRRASASSPASAWSGREGPRAQESRCGGRAHRQLHRLHEHRHELRATARPARLRDGSGAARRQ